MSVSRRFFLGRSGLGLAVVGWPTMAVAGGRPASLRGEPRRIIHMVSDGMTAGTMTCGDLLSKLTRERSSAWMALARQPEAVSGWMNMRSLNSVVTDSAAASSSWGSGSRVKNGSLNVLPDGRQLVPLCSAFGEAGWARGLVTTTEITHATPAGFAANVSDRGTADQIAVQYLERRLDVLLGGGSQYFDPAKRKDKRDVAAEYSAWGYTVMRTRADLMKAPTRDRWLGTFASGHLPFTVDRQHTAALQQTVPTLAEMTERALDWLGRRDRFLLQVEGGRVDHGAHASDAAAAFFDQVEFEEALEVVLKFQRRSGDTLVVVTTDHGTGGATLNGMGGSYNQSATLFANLKRVRRSFGEIATQLTKLAGKDAVGELKSADGKTTRSILRVEPKVVTQVLGETTGYEVPAAKAEQFARYLRGEQLPLNDSMDSQSAQLGQLMANYLGVGWTSSAHTADFVPITAIGPGAERFRGFIQNTDVFRNYTELAGLRVRNPELPLLSESRPDAAEAERWALV